MAESSATVVPFFSTSSLPVARSRWTMLAGSVGAAPRNTTRSPSARTDEMSVYGVSSGVTTPLRRSIAASRSRPFSIYEQTRRSGPANAYVYIPKTHCGSPNSAAMGATGWTVAVATSNRYRFHQPDRSDTKISERPSGDHSGWKTDSSGPPAMAAPSRYSVVPSHGMFG